MAAIITVEEINEIFAESDRLKAKGSGKDNSVETRRASMVKKTAEMKMFFYNNATNLNNHEDNSSKPYYVATFKALDGDQVKCQVIPEERGECGVPELKKDSISVPLKDTFEFSMMAYEGIPDMVEIDELNPATLLYNLMARYKREKIEIYTYVGPILLVLNPFKDPGLNSEENRMRYVEITKSEQPLTLKKQLEPHAFALSALAYSTMKIERARQGIVISGESGAGKTESAKTCMDFLTKLVSDPDMDPNDDIGRKILACNPILESFGNAKTVRNDNSSRFGKYVLMYFAMDGDKVYGARIKNYLLEKSRVVMVNPGERGYHIFYFILGGLNADSLSKLSLTGKTWSDFNFLKTGGVREEDVQKEFDEVLDTMNKMSFTPEEQMKIWQCCAAILHMGQIQFDKMSFADESKVGIIKNSEVVDIVAGLLDIEDKAYFKRIVLEKVNVIRGQAMWTPLKYQECLDNVMALSKKLFDNLFNWLVIRMNKTIEPEELNDERAESFVANTAKTIGLLDIFGFENFAKNSFEQFCINYVNEKLHKLYIAAIFEAEKQELTLEGLAEVAENIEYPETQVLDILRMMDYSARSVRYKGITFAQPPKPGIFTTVDDKAVNPRPTKWEDIFEEIDGNHKAPAKTPNPVYFKTAKKRDEFTISHSAQKVSYDIKEFRDRDVDFIPEGLENTMCDKTGELISKIYQGKIDADEEVKRDKAKTIWVKFGRQMDDLMNELGEPLIVMKEETGRAIPEDAEPCQLHFVRCIKPRPKPMSKTDRPGLFVHSMTLQQITYMGVLESVDLKQKNYPFRKKFEEFYGEYELLSSRYSTMRYYQMKAQGLKEPWKDHVNEIFAKCLLGLGLNDKKYAIGDTKVLMMPQIKQVLDVCLHKASAEYTKRARTLKESFMPFAAALIVRKKMRSVRLIQDRYRLIYARRQRKQREHFKEVFEKAIVQFKADKRFILEQKAGKRIQDVLEKHTFRNKLMYGLNARETIVKHTYNRAYINRVGKLLLCLTLQKRIVNNAFSMARKTINDRAAWNMQRAIRGFLNRNKEGRLDVVKNALAEKENLRLHVSAKKIQKRLKGLIVRRRIAYINKIASQVQSYCRMRWFRQVFQKIRTNTMVLQRAVRRYMARRDMIKERMRDYLTQEYQIMDNVREMENFMLFGSEGNGALVKQQTPYSAKKIFLFSRIIDMHVITDLSDMHQTPWSSQFMKLYQDNLVNDTPIMHLSVGQAHSIACTGRGRTYVWGWNDNGQCAKDPLLIDEVIVKNTKMAQLDISKFQRGSQIPGAPEQPSRCKQLLAVEDRCIVQLQEGTRDLIVWGGNERGQLGLGHYSEVHEPTRLSFFSKQNLTVNSFASGGNLTLAACETGESFAWPFTKQGQKVSYPVRMPFSDSIKVKRVSCGYNFGFFISQQGQVYAVGKDNQDGQLGLGHVYPNDIPELVTCFKAAGERIDQIECGYRHAIARSTLGKVYTWGWNAHGQLGHGTFESELSPRQLYLERGKMNRDKAVQIAAGYSHTVIMAEASRELFWFGTSGELTKQSTPVILNLAEKIPSLYPGTTAYGQSISQQIDFANVKVSCSWSKTISTTNLMLADLRAINQDENYSKITQVLDRLSKNWDQRDVMPPYIDVIANLFSANVMRKNGATAPGARNTGLSGTKTATMKNLTSARTQGRTTPYKR